MRSLSQPASPSPTHPSCRCRCAAGLANPGPVAAALWTDAELESSVCLDAVVTVVDAKNILRQLRDRHGVEGGEAKGGDRSTGLEDSGSGSGSGAVNEAQQQLAFADVVLLNKVCPYMTMDRLSTEEKAWSILLESRTAAPRQGCC
jgi:G3E family GTPase